MAAMVAVTLLAAGLLAAGPLAPADSPDVKVVEEIVAKVNGSIISRGELEKNAPTVDTLRDKIDALLLVARANELNIKVDADINRRFAQLQTESGIADPDKFHRWVFERFGISFEDLRQQQTDLELIRRVISQEVGAHINIPKEEIQDYYDWHKADFVRQEQVFLREILISAGDGSPAALAAAEKTARDLVTRARKGEKFPELARRYSDAETAKADGELGAFKKGDLVKPLEDVVFLANKGYVSDPIRIHAGFEILKVDEHYAAGQASLEDVKDEIMDRLYTPRLQPELRKYLTRLREDAFIQIRDGFVDSAAAPGKDTSWKDPAMLKPETTTKEEVAAHSRKRNR
jgi:peptidyl-prolyl cis-trans isomerase SurA